MNEKVFTKEELQILFIDRKTPKGRKITERERVEAYPYIYRRLTQIGGRDFTREVGPEIADAVKKWIRSDEMEKRLEILQRVEGWEINLRTNIAQLRMIYFLLLGKWEIISPVIEEYISFREFFPKTLDYIWEQNRKGIDFTPEQERAVHAMLATISMAIRRDVVLRRADFLKEKDEADLLEEEKKWRVDFSPSGIGFDWKETGNIIGDGLTSLLNTYAMVEEGAVALELVIKKWYLTPLLSDRMSRTLELYTEYRQDVVLLIERIRVDSAKRQKRIEAQKNRPDLQADALWLGQIAQTADSTNEARDLLIVTDRKKYEGNKQYLETGFFPKSWKRGRS